MQQGVENTATEKTFVNTLMESWLEEKLRLWAAEKRLSKGEVIRRALIAYFDLDGQGQGANDGLQN